MSHDNDERPQGEALREMAFSPAYLEMLAGMTEHALKQEAARRRLRERVRAPVAGLRATR